MPESYGPIQAVCVYCASSEAVPPLYRHTAAELGSAIAEQGWELVYGGGSIGLMGELARAALACGAHVTGVIPHRLARKEMLFAEASELVRTETMRERKAVMDERSDAFIILPGGIGTLEELVEIITLKQLGYHDRPVVILDAAGFWDPFITQLKRMVDEALAHSSILDLWQITHDVPATITALRTYTPPPPARVLPVHLQFASTDTERFDPGEEDAPEAGNGMVGPGRAEPTERAQHRGDGDTAS